MTTVRPRAAAALFAMAALAAAAPASAQSLSTPPAPGLWESQHTTRINGQDLGALMRQQMAAMLQSMPAAQRAQAESTMQGRMGAVMGGKQQDCLTPAQAKRLSDPATLLADLNKGSAQCRFQPPSVDGNTITFQGRCEDPNGFTGDLSGQYTLQGPKAWTGRWSGEGRMRGIEQMPGLNIPAGSTVKVEVDRSGRWVAAACGTVAPR